MSSNILFSYWQFFLSFATCIHVGPATNSHTRARTHITPYCIVFSQELRPDELVELSFLRQRLENALAVELSPHERDVIRLRLGLDDGQSRTAKEVAAVCGNRIDPNDVRRTERRAFRKLSHPSTVFVHNLKDFLHVAGIGTLGDDYTFQPYR